LVATLVLKESVDENVGDHAFRLRKRQACKKFGRVSQRSPQIRLERPLVPHDNRQGLAQGLIRLS